MSRGESSPWRRTVLAYHAIGEPSSRHPHRDLFVSVESFAAQMRLLARHRDVVPLAEILEPCATRKPAVAITFDDAYESVFENGLPILLEHGFPATIFVSTAWIGLYSGWELETDVQLPIASASRLCEASAKGFDIESHGHAHIDLSSAATAKVENDLRTSVQQLQSLIGVQSRFLCYPFGKASIDVQETARRVGFEAAFTLGGDHGGRFAHERIWIGPHDNNYLFYLKSAGMFHGLRRRRVGGTAYEVVRHVLGGRQPWRRRDRSKL